MNEIIQSALEIGGIGIAGVFLFMLLFFVAIKIIEKTLPPKDNE